jgi:ABC-type nitrate/sulfonate/bicarbonate transport system permease component
MSRRWLLIAVEIAVPVAIIALIWVWSAGSGIYYYPPLQDVLSTFKDTWLFDRFGSDVVPSLERLFAGYLIAVAVGVGGGVALGLSAVTRRVWAPVVEFLRSIPAPALLPFALLVFGVGDGSKIFVIAFVCVWPILLNALDGIAGVDPTLVDTGLVYRIPARDRLTHVVLPAAAPQIFAGMRTSLSLALILMVVSEMVASSNGIGYFVLQSQRSFAIPEMWSGIILLGLLGYVFNAVFLLLERRALAWHRGARAGAQ